jgi:hypothetical protein
MKYNRKKIEELDPRQCVYVSFHDGQFGSSNLVVNGKTYAERAELYYENKELFEKYSNIGDILSKYPSKEAYLWHNMRGTTVVFRTSANERMFRWNRMKKLR